jgi:hypothetical protein
MITGSTNIHHIAKVEIGECGRTIGNNYDTMEITLIDDEGNSFDVTIFGDDMKSIEVVHKDADFHQF